MVSSSAAIFADAFSGRTCSESMMYMNYTLSRGRSVEWLASMRAARLKVRVRRRKLVKARAADGGEQKRIRLRRDDAIKPWVNIVMQSWNQAFARSPGGSSERFAQTCREKHLSCKSAHG